MHSLLVVVSFLYRVVKLGEVALNIIIVKAWRSQIGASSPTRFLILSVRDGSPISTTLSLLVFSYCDRHLLRDLLCFFLKVLLLAATFPIQELLCQFDCHLFAILRIVRPQVLHESVVLALEV